ncbi:MAG: acetyl-CoA synthetase [marine bacterium B5-7]|nr:MAG: acetyl-CoA synthetase [marine bacterium B5-7]
MATPAVLQFMNAADEIVGKGRLLAGDDAPALIEAERTLTYKQLDLLVNRYGNAMLAAGISAEDRVLFMLDDSSDFIAAYLAAIRIGAVAVAFNLRASSNDLRHVIDETRAPLLLIEADLLDVFAGIENRLEHKPKVFVNQPREQNTPSLVDFLNDHCDQLKSIQLSPDDMACWVYSSGTTGAPKAVVHLHHDVLEAERHLTENLSIKPRDRLFCSSKLFFAYALGNILFGGLRAGATLILNRGWPDADRVVDVIERYQPDYFFTVPTFYRSLLTEGIAERPAFHRLRGCISAGENLPSCLLENWHEVTGQPIYEGIGTSETLFLVIANHPHAWKPGCTGRPQPWVGAKLLDDDQQTINDVDGVGMLWIKSSSVADRYWNRQQLSRSTFVGDWYATGDMFSFDNDGWWRHHGRADSMLKISGQWVSPVEIEERACTAEGVADVAVVGKTNEHGLVRATMFVVPKNQPCNEGQFRDHLMNHLQAGLAIYKCPRDIRLVEKLPRTITGKVQRYVLRDWIR